MPLKNLKPLIGIGRDEPFDFKKVSEDQRDRIGLAGSCWILASGLLALTFIASANAQETNTDPKTERCYVRGPFGVGGWTNCR